MKLYVSIENTGKGLTLKPERKYFFGSNLSNDSDVYPIPPEAGYLSDRHLSFFFDSSFGLWYVEDLGSVEGTYVNSQLITSPVPLDPPTRIRAGSVTLIATAANLNTAPTYQPVQPPVLTTYQPPVYSQSQDAYTKPISTKGIKVLSWKEFVEVQATKYGDWFTRMRIRFHLATGFRDTIWVKKGATEDKAKYDGFDAFDGYILPDFTSGSKQDARLIASGIAEQLFDLRKYENTDCHVTRLTDAHVVNSATQSFIGVELFPIKRAGEPDYRNFCVVSYHRVRTYLLVEDYGTDLFVSWITRFEPEPTSFFTILWTFLAVIATLFSMGTNSFYLLMLPAFLWTTAYLALPNLMLWLGILPKRANGRLLLFIIYSVGFSFIAAGLNLYGNQSSNIIFAILFFLLIGYFVFLGLASNIKDSGSHNKNGDRR